MQERGRQWATVALVTGSVAFGMVLAGGLDWTPSGSTQPPAAPPAEETARPVLPGPSGLPSFGDLADAASPAVVSIRSVSFEEARPERLREMEPFFEFFWGPRGRREDQPDEPQEFRSESGGSGFLISPDGLVVTNNHVVEGAAELVVHLGDRDYSAKVRGTDPATDIALLQIDAAEELPYLPLGDSDALRVGDWVMVIGNPLRLAGTVTVGVVSAKGRALGITDPSFENFIQTDAAINFGNSGGPMVNLQGEVVGIATAINWGSENIGFSIPVSTLKAVLPQLEKEGRVRRGYLGVEPQNIDFRVREAFHLKSNDGALVNRVLQGTPAEEAGLRHGDIILRVDDVEVATTRDLIDYVAQHPPGSQLTLRILRGGRVITSRVTLGERPEAGAESETDTEAEPSGIDWLGIRYQDLTPGLKASQNLPAELRGLWVRSVSPRSPLISEDVRPGDVITEVNGRPVTGVDTFEAAVREVSAGDFLRLYVQRYDPGSGDLVRQFFAFAQVP